jgi:hypothetical protein
VGLTRLAWHCEAVPDLKSAGVSPRFFCVRLLHAVPTFYCYATNRFMTMSPGRAM